MTSLTEEKLPPCWKCGNVVKFCEGSTFVYECSLCQILVGWGATRQEALNDLLGAFVWKQLSERESVIAKLRAEVKEANIGEFDAMFRENDFKERFYAECKETEALKSKLGEAEKVLRLCEQIPELHPSNYDHDEVCNLNTIANKVCSKQLEFLSSLRSKPSGSDGEGGEGKA